MTNKDLEKLLQEGKQHTCQLKAEIDRLRGLQPVSELDYTLLKERLEMVENDANYWQSAYVEIKGELAKIKEVSIKIQEDNSKLLDGYYVGITQEKETREANREYNIMAAENRKLKGMLAAKEEVIQYYRRLAADQTGDALESVIEEAKNSRKQTGRPRIIDDKMKVRIRKLRREGLTIREIASREGVSLGTVTEVCKDVKKKDYTCELYDSRRDSL